MEASDWTDLGVVDPFTTIVLSPVHLFLAGGLRFGRPEREGTEQIKPIQMSLPEAVQAVLDGRITHGSSSVLILKAGLRAPAASPGPLPGKGR